MTSKPRSFATAGGIAAAVALALMTHAPQARAQASPALKQAVAAGVDAKAKLVQEMVDSVFSFAEPGFQEFKTSEYITGILEKNGFKITRGVAGIPTAWTATWGEGGPLIALGSDIDALLGLSQYPGIKEIKQVMADAARAAEMGSRTILFIDEIHRFNKAQQDAFLPYVERGAIRLIGATT